MKNSKTNLGLGMNRAQTWLDGNNDRQADFARFRLDMAVESQIRVKEWEKERADEKEKNKLKEKGK